VKLAGHVALITGAAGGIGSVVAKALICASLTCALHRKSWPNAQHWAGA
jgi:NAD(P)-dependent dehydrogenase (short-subunit alcohol dehydrogenase family)